MGLLMARPQSVLLIPALNSFPTCQKDGHYGTTPVVTMPEDTFSR